MVQLARNFDVQGIFFRNAVTFNNVTTFKIDIRDKSVVGLLRKIDPDIVVHASAFTNVDGCETDKAKACRVNIEGVKNIAQGIGDSKLIYISTDYIFDGEKGMYQETDKPNPINFYGKTKLEGELVVKKMCKNYVIARTSVLYGWHTNQNFVVWLINKLQSGNKVNIVTDQFNSPTLADDLAEQILGLIEHDEQGIFHTAGMERISRFDFAIEIARKFKLDQTLINPVKSENLNWIARRPKDTSLDIERISKIKNPLTISQSLDRMRKQKG